jgi:putative transposase
MDTDRTFFITTVTAQRQIIFRRETTADLLIATLSHYRDERKYLLHEFVIMPDHVHALITPSAEISLERAVQFIKGGSRQSRHFESRGRGIPHSPKVFPK